MADLFLSYARADSREFVARLSAELQDRGKDTWVDLDDIPPASSWNDDLRAGIAASDCFCFVISPGSIGSPHCRAELEHAVALGKRILPVLHLPVVDAEVPEAVGSRNWIPQVGRFADDFDAALDTLVVAVDTDLDWVREHTRWGLKAQEWVRRGEDRSLLTRGSDLDQAEAFVSGAAGREPAPTEVQGRYVIASRRAASRRQRQLVAGVSVALVVSLVLGVLALLQRNTAVAQRKEAETQRAAATSRALAANAFLTLPTDPELSVLLGLKAAAASPTGEAENALRSGILEDRLRARLNHGDAVTFASYSPDGKEIVTTSEDGTAALWDAATADRIAVLAGHAQPPFGARWSADGARVVTVAQDATARVWDGRTGASVSVIRDPDDYRLTDVAISADGSVVVTSGFVQQQVHFWDAASGALLATIPRDTVDQIALNPDNSLLLVANQGKGVDLWDTSSATLVASYPGDAQAYFTAAAFSADGSAFATAGGDGRVTVRNLAGDLVASVRYDGEVTGLDFSPSGALLASASEDGTAKVTDLKDGATLATFTGHVGAVRSVAFSRDSTLVATGGVDGLVQEWLPGSGALVATLAGHRAPVNAVAFSPVSDRLVSASDDRTARIWSASASGGGFERRRRVDLGGGYQGVFSENGAYAAYEGVFDDAANVPLNVVDAGSGQIRAGFVLDHRETWLPAVSNDGTLVVTTNFTGDTPLTQVRRASGGSVVSTIDAPGPAGAGFDQDGSRVIVTGDAGSAAIYDVESGRQLVALSGSATDVPVSSGVFSPDGKRVMTAGEDGTVRIWDASTGKQLQLLTAFGPVPPRNIPNTYLSFSPDGDRVVTASIFENVANLWDVRTGDQISRLEGIGAGASDVAFSPSGRFLLTSDNDGNVRLWDGRSGRQLSLVANARVAAIGASFDQAEQQLELMVRVDNTGDASILLDVYDCDICGELGSLVTLGASRVTRGLTATEKATYLVGASG